MAQDNNIFNRLRKLFSSNVVVRNIGGKKLKVADTAGIQSIGNTNMRTDRFKRVHTSGGQSNPFVGYNSGYGYVEYTRNEMYGDYEIMDKDPIIHSALNIFADESTVRDEENEILKIYSDNTDIKEVLSNLFYDILNVDFNLNSWIRNLCKYGDFYLALDIAEDYGIVNAIPLSPYYMYRLDGSDPSNPYDVKFMYDAEGAKSTFENYEIAHFRMLGDTNFLPYGRSIIEGSRHIYKQLYLMEEAMLIHRITRAPDKRIFKVDVGNLNPNEIDQYMEKLANQMQKIPYIDSNTGEYNLKYNMENLLEDFYLAVRGGNSGTEIDTLSGLQYNAIEDIEYLQNKLFASLTIPKPFLTYEEGVEGKSVLTQLDIRFGRTIQRIQRIVVSELTKIAIVHLYSQGFRNEDLMNFTLNLINPSIIFDQERLNLFQAKLDLVQSANDSNVISTERIYKDVFGFSDDDIAQEREKLVEDAKNKFRLEQISMEGNDPVKTNESYGTPHDLASMHMSSDNSFKESPNGETPEGGWEGAGRPSKIKSTYGTDQHYMGRDPVGKKSLHKAVGMDKNLGNNFSKYSPFKMDSVIPKIKNKQIIKESLENIKIDTKDSYKSTFLDENNLK